MADAGGARPADHVISMEEGVEASSSPQQQQPPPPSARQHLQKRLSHLASSLRSSALELHVGSIDEMDDHIRHEETLERESHDAEARPHPAPPAAAAAAAAAADLAFEDGGRLGRFLVSKRVGLSLGEAAGHGAAGGSIVDVPVVVFLFGWLTCQDRHLKKYAELYHSMGLPLVCRHTVPPLKVMRGGQRGVVRAAEEMYALAQTRFRHAMVVVHMLSNGGAFVHWRLLRLLQRRHRSHSHRGGSGSGSGSGRPSAPSSPADLFPNLAATIFDSAPAAADAEAGAKAMSASQHNKAMKGLVYGCVRFGLEVWGLVQLYTFQTAYLRDMKGDFMTSPSLYIYSEADEITDPAIVEACMAQRRAYLSAKGLAGESLIEGWRVKESHHVCHYPHAPEAYRGRLLAFLDKQGCLPSSSSSPS